MQPLKDPIKIDQTLPLGSLLLNKIDKNYSEKLAKLNQIQEIIDDFTLESKKKSNY